MTKTTLTLLLLLLATFTATAQQNPFFMSDEVTVEPLSVNTFDNEAGPTIIDGILYYTSLKNSNINIPDAPSDFYKLYTIPMYRACTATRGYPDNTLNNNFHNGPLTFSPTTGEMFITRSDVENYVVKNRIFKQKKEINLKIEIYTLESGQWKFKENFLYNSPHYSLAHPSVNHTGDTLYFASDQPGGFGKTDIYYSVRENGEWQPPVNAGPGINTRKHEITPFISSSGTLFFASDGHKGEGRFDIFFATTDANGQFNAPVNAGDNINTRADEYGYTAHPQKPIAYFVSNKNNKKDNDDIWCICSEEYKPQQVHPDEAEIEINRIVKKINENLHVLTRKMTDSKFIDKSITYNCKYAITDTQRTPDLQLSFGYKLKVDTLKAGINCYNLSTYTTDQSHAVVLLLQAINHHFENDLKSYLSQAANINIEIHTNTDGINVFSDTNYEGEYGIEPSGTIQIKDSVFTMGIKENTPLNHQHQIAFLRAYGIKQHLASNTLQHTTQRANIQYHIHDRNEIDKNQNWINITFTLENAFANY